MSNSPARAAIDVGSIIDKYVIEALIGQGGMGAVFVARHRTLTDKRVAIKVLHTEITDPDIQARFKREAQIATRINHPNIVEVHDFDVTPDGVPFLVLEYLEGQTLAQRLAQGPIPLEQVMAIVRQVGSALAAAHREGVVHRDLKPQNIFLVPTEVDGRMVEVAKVLDFGISKWRGSETVKTQESALLGTPQYMSPEQATGRHDSVDARTDVFALGSIVYEMLCGHPAFTGSSIPEVVFKVVYEQPLPIAQSVPDSVATAVRTAMSKPADERYATVSSFVEALTGTALSTFRPSMITRPPGEGFASGSKKIASNEALGDTMGSGDYAGAAPTAPPAITPAQLVRASSPTVDSVSSKDPSGQIGIAATSASSAPARPKSAMWWVIAAVGAIAATVAIMYVVMRTPTDSPLATTPPVTEQPVVTQPPPDAAIQVATAPPDAAVQVAATPPDAAVTPPKKTPKPDAGDTRPPDRRGPDPEDDDAVRETLERAQAAFTSGDYELANRLANVAVNRGGPRQRVQGSMLKGFIACEKKDLELVNAALNNLAGRPTFRKKVIARCQQRGVDVR